MHSDAVPPSALRRFFREESGFSLTEYVLVASLIAVVCVLAVLALGRAT